MRVGDGSSGVMQGVETTARPQKLHPRWREEAHPRCASSGAALQAGAEGSAGGGCCDFPPPPPPAQQHSRLPALPPCCLVGWGAPGAGEAWPVLGTLQADGGQGRGRAPSRAPVCPLGYWGGSGQGRGVCFPSSTALSCSVLQGGSHTPRHGHWQGCLLPSPSPAVPVLSTQRGCGHGWAQRGLISPLGFLFLLSRRLVCLPRRFSLPRRMCAVGAARTWEDARSGQPVPSPAPQPGGRDSGRSPAAAGTITWQWGFSAPGRGAVG